jgi:hypothetical protein
MAYDEMTAKLVAENASLKAEVERMREALEKAEGNFYNMANTIDDADYRGSIPGVYGVVVGHREEYHKGYVQWLVRYAEEARAALTPLSGATDMSDAKTLAAEYLERAKLIGGCGDGNCVVLRPVGMHTNGGCRCVKHMDTQQLMGVRSLLMKAQQMARLLTKEPRT